MGIHSKRQYLQTIRLRYKDATREQKSHILEEFCSVCGYNRKYAIWLLNANGTKKTKTKNKAGRKPIYDHPDILEVLMEIWKEAELPCATRLKEIIPEWLPYFKKFIIEDDIKEKLLAMSASTIDRLMAKSRPAFTRRGLATTKPGSIIRKQIPVKTNQWDESIPGFIEADTVAHCGTTTEGSYVFQSIASISPPDGRSKEQSGVKAHKALWRQLKTLKKPCLSQSKVLIAITVRSS